MRRYRPMAPDPGRDWTARPVPGVRAVKAYRCPGCDHEIAAGTPHLVVWPDEDVEARRHWHTACWRLVSPAEQPSGSP